MQDCVHFDNIATRLYLGGDFSTDIYHLLQLYFPKELEQLELKCEIETISNNYLQFLGGIELIRKRID